MPYKEPIIFQPDITNERLARHLSEALFVARQLLYSTSFQKVEARP